VDEIEFVGGILDKIYNSIVNSKIIIAEVSSLNPNVYYELGYAHALNKPVILITKDISSAPFDLRNYNHIVYKNIVDLREKLKRRLGVLLGS
jgi:nucleoside 2-deoxyribosyltransferase